MVLQICHIREDLWYRRYWSWSRAEDSTNLLAKYIAIVAKMPSLTRVSKRFFIVKPPSVWWFENQNIMMQLELRKCEIRNNSYSIFYKSSINENEKGYNGKMYKCFT